MMICVFPAQLIGRKIRIGVPHMNVTCMTCKRSADIPDVLLDLVAEHSEENRQQFLFCCDMCMFDKTDETAHHFIEKVIFKNANSN